jgi:prepilin-type processing-associated H-X9-DG protein
MMTYAVDYDDGFPAWDEHLGMSGPGAEPPYTGYSFALGGDPRGAWQTKLQPYIKSGAPEKFDNTGVWKCPSLGARGERTKSSTGGVDYSYGYSQIFMRNNAGGLAGLGTQYYRYPNQIEMDSPANTITVGECSSPGRLAPPHFFQTWTLRRAGTLTGAWEVPDRHSEGSNYVFGDGHAKWLRNQTAYPDGPVNTANRKKAYKATADYFAYNDAERSAWLALSR